MENVFITNETVDVEEAVDEPKRKKREKGERDRKTLRADPELIEKLENALEAIGGTQKDMVQHIVHLLDLDAARREAPGAANMIEEFNNLVSKLQKTFHYAIELKESAEERAESSVVEKLESKDKTIADLQNKNEALKVEIESLKAEKIAQTETEARLIDRVEAAEEAAKRAEDALADKNQIIEMQKAQLTDLERAKSDLDSANAAIESYRSDIADLKKAKENADRLHLEAAEKCDKIIAENTENTNRIKADHARDLANEREKAETAKRAAAIEAREDAQKKIDSYIEKIEKKDDEIARLQAEIMELKLQRPSKKAEKAEEGTQQKLDV